MTETWGPREPIETESLVLRPHTRSDLDDIAEYHGDPEVVRYVPWPVRDRAATGVALEQKIRRGAPNASENWLVLAVEHKNSGKVVGEVLLKRDPESAALGELGYAFSRDVWGTGIAFEACTAMLHLGFNHYNMHRICALIIVENTASAGLATRLGMRHEARLIEAAWFKGAWETEDVYAVLDREFFARNTAV